MTEQQIATPIVLRADITRDELRALKAQAALKGMTVQAYVAEIVRSHI